MKRYQNESNSVVFIQFALKSKDCMQISRTKFKIQNTNVFDRIIILFDFRILVKDTKPMYSEKDMMKANTIQAIRIDIEYFFLIPSGRGGPSIILF